MAHSFQVTFDSNDPHVLADWWAEALGWVVEPQDEGFIRQLVEAGQATEEDTAHHRGRLVWKVGTAIVHPDDPLDSPDRRRVLFQLVPEPKVVKNRVHLDVQVGEDQVEAESERLVALGATFSHRGQQGPYRWITLADPEGNELCLA
jgi:hypothetical protein